MAQCHCGNVCTHHFSVDHFFGSYIQAVAGFAMGMLIVAVAGGLRLIELETLAAVVSILSLTNSVLSLWGQVGQVHWRLFSWLALGQVPALMLGLFFLDQLGANARWALELCLGVFLTLGALGMLLSRNPYSVSLRRGSPG